MNRTVLFGFLGLAVAWSPGRGNAQQPSPEFLPVENLELELPSSVDSGEGFRAIRAADLLGIQRVDLVALSDTTPVVLFAPSVYQAAMCLDSTGTWIAHDLSVLPGDSGLADAVVTAGPLGISTWVFDAVTRGFIEQEVSSVPMRACAVVQSQPPTPPSIVGLTLEGSELYWFDGPSTRVFPLGEGEGFALQALQWQGVGEQVAVLLANGVLVMNEDGVVLASHSGGNTIAMTRFRRQGSAADHLAWVDEDNASGSTFGQWLNLARAGGGLGATPPPPDSIPLGTLGVTGISAGDVNGDREPDLFFTTHDRCEVIGLWGQEEADYSMAESFLLKEDDNSEPCSGNVRALWCADLDSNGWMDVIGHVPSQQRLFLARNRSLPAIAAYVPQPCVETWRGQLTVHFPYLPKNSTPEILVFQGTPQFGQPGSSLPAADPVAWWSFAGTSVLSWDGTIQFRLDADLHQEPYYIVSRLHRNGVAGPDSVYIYQEGAVSCLDGTSPPGLDKSAAATVVGDPRKNEGLDPRSRVIFGPVTSPPGEP